MRAHKAKKLYQNQKMWFFAVLTACISVLALYMYFLSASVVHVVMRKEVNQEIAAISSYVSQLESEYIHAQHKVSDEIASMRGYTVATDKIFIDRTSDSLVLSSNDAQ